MKILSAKQIQQADAFTIKAQGIPSIDLMERAARELYFWFHKNISRQNKVAIFCGQGNNGGDGLALGRMLLLAGYQVQVFVVQHREKPSQDFEINLQSLLSLDVFIHNIKSIKEILDVDADVMVDALLGSGLNAPLSGILLEIVTTLNKNEAFKIAVDIPTGLYAETNTAQSLNTCFKADVTLTFQMPKLSFLIPESGNAVGEFFVLDIGLDQDFITQAESPFFYLTQQDLSFLKPRLKFTHKGTYGHALLIAGSQGKMGAAILSAQACLHSGVGLLTVAIPQAGVLPMHASVPETMIETVGEQCFDTLPLQKEYGAIGVGPGLGSNPSTAKTLLSFLSIQNKPMVLDADALNILSEQKAWSLVPKNSILTPHPGEFKRMFNTNRLPLFSQASSFAVLHQFIVVLKGAHSAVCLPTGEVYFNSTGNPGMATGGSGDVLTGLILGLLAQGYPPKEAALLAVYLHGKAGDLSATKNSEESLVALDLVKNMGLAFLSLKQEQDFNT